MKKCAFGQNLEQSLSKQLILSYCGNRINTPGGHLYIKLTDASGHAYELDSCSDLKYENWRLWIINLNDFAAGDVNTTEISKLALGIKYALNTAGSGVVYMDNIELPERKKEEFNADIRGSDGKVDMLDLAVLMQHWLVSY
jgi:hypothetical protein